MNTMSLRKPQTLFCRIVSSRHMASAQSSKTRRLGEIKLVAGSGNPKLTRCLIWSGLHLTSAATLITALYAATSRLNLRDLTNVESKLLVFPNLTNLTLLTRQQKALGSAPGSIQTMPKSVDLSASLIKAHVIQRILARTNRPQTRRIKHKSSFKRSTYESLPQNRSPTLSRRITVARPQAPIKALIHTKETRRNNIPNGLKPLIRLLRRPHLPA